MSIARGLRAQRFENEFDMRAGMRTRKRFSRCRWRNRLQEIGKRLFVQRRKNRAQTIRPFRMARMRLVFETRRMGDECGCD